MIVSVVRRIAILVLTILAASSAVFVLIHLSGDPTDGFLAPGASPEVREAARERLGLDQPIIQQYGEFVARTFTGDFGDSWRNRQPALAAVLDRLPATLQLAAVAIAISVTLGLTLGVLSAWIGFGPLRWGVRLFAMLGQAFPAFWLGTLGIMVFAVELGWLSPSGNDGWRALILPAFTLAAYPGSLIARMTQTSLLDVASRPYITHAHAKGLPPSAVWLRHSLPNALLPTLAIIGLQAGFLVGGTIVVESVFAYPGLGRLALQATTERDLPVIQAFVVVTIVLVSLVNVVVDQIATAIDPTQREARLAVNGG
ncbi:MAG: ABC transporter permease [Chloroflexia bacterium]|nr:ABC transporter permease [Chloroflexia bacterium]